MWLIVMRGMPGCGKSTVARALGRQLEWPIIDKDDIKDILDAQVPASGGLAYETMWNVARRQLLQGLNVIADSPLTFLMAYEKARAIAQETGATLAIIECRCSDEQVWRQRINARKELQLPAHHQTDWDTFLRYRQQMLAEMDYPITDLNLVVDTVRPLTEGVAEIIIWLESHTR
jgi:predicted kinase